jgi:hypothetical protein
MSDTIIDWKAATTEFIAMPKLNGGGIIRMAVRKSAADV